MGLVLMTTSCASGMFDVGLEVISIEVYHRDAIAMQVHQECDPIHPGQLGGQTRGKAFHLEQLHSHRHPGFLLKVRSGLL
jgi:hypothetical protein